MQTTTKKRLNAITLAITLSLGATASIAAIPAHASIPSAANTTTTHTSIPDTEEQQLQHASTLAQSGREAMSYIVAARQLLSDQHGDEARQYLEKARSILTKLQSEVGAQKDNANGLLPIYSQLGITKDVEITDQIKQRLDNIYPDVVRGKHKQVVEALKTVGIELQYSFVDLPIPETLGKVESALNSISEKNIQEAGKTLADAEADLIHDSVVINAIDVNPAG